MAVGVFQRYKQEEGHVGFGVAFFLCIREV